MTDEASAELLDPAPKLDSRRVTGDSRPEGELIMLRVDGHLVEEGGRPLRGLNVRGFGHGTEDALVPLGHDTTDDDGCFLLEVEGRSEASLSGTSLRLHFEVLDGSLNLVHRT